MSDRRFAAAIVGIAVVVAFGAGCKAKEAAPRAEPAVPPMPAEEVQRSQDACRIYVEKVCACADKLAAAKEPCQLGRALPDAVRIGLEVAASPDSKARDALGAQDSVRKAFKSCVELTAKLPVLGCP